MTSDPLDRTRIPPVPGVRVPDSRVRVHDEPSGSVIGRELPLVAALSLIATGSEEVGVDGIVIRAAGAEDATFLEDMLVEAANMPSHLGRSRAEALADPAVWHYVEGWPRVTDLGVVAERSGHPIGAAWLRYFEETAPAYGFVRPDVPELAIGVDAASRGGGVGRALLRALRAEARQRGIAQISLSVERANPAARLYAAEGFAVVDRREHADTMLLSL